MPRELAFYQADKSARALTEQIKVADDEFSSEPAWRHLRQQFELSDFEVDLLALSIAANIDPSLHRAYAYLRIDDAGAWAMPRLGSRECCSSTLRCLLSIRKRRWWSGDWRRRSTQAPIPGQQTPCGAPDPHIMLWLAGSATVDPVLGSAVKFYSGQNCAGQLCLYPEQLEEMIEFARCLGRDRTTPEQKSSIALEIELLGPAGAGKRTLAAQFAATLGADLLSVDTETLLAPDTPRSTERERLLHAIRMARLGGAILYWQGDAGISSRIWQAIGGGSGVKVVWRAGSQDRAQQVTGDPLVIHASRAPVEPEVRALAAAQFVSAASVRRRVDAHPWRDCESRATLPAGRASN